MPCLGRVIRGLEEGHEKALKDERLQGAKGAKNTHARHCGRAADRQPAAAGKRKEKKLHKRRQYRDHGRLKVHLQAPHSRTRSEAGR